MKCLCSILILTSAKFLSKIQCRNTNILPGFDNYKITTRKTKQNKTKPTRLNGHISFLLLFKTGDTPDYYKEDQIRFPHQAESSQQLLLAFGESFAYFQKEFDNSHITLPSNEYIKAGENMKLQLFLCPSENKI